MPALPHDADAPPLATPAFIYDERGIRDRLALFDRIREISGVNLLYSIKAQPFAGILELIAPAVAGFSVSSLFEARLASGILNTLSHPVAAVHLTTPGLRAGEMPALGQQCTTVSFNSLEQCRRLLPALDASVPVGLRVNPRHSVIADARYDPCRAHSKLGIPLEDLKAALEEDAGLASRISGIHFHTQFGATDAGPLQAILQKLEEQLGTRLDALQWINLGGGYDPPAEAGALALGRVIRAFRERHALEVWMEPGQAIVGEAGSLLTTVVDCFERDGQAIAVLDTGVQHLPEVFEYQRAPPLKEHRSEGAHAVLLAGCSCLAGDLFGEYRFARPLSVGDRVTFERVGAYSLIKASWFNGYGLPSVYLRKPGGRMQHMKSYAYEDYHKQWST